jgi:hypothetical protein
MINLLGAGSAARLLHRDQCICLDCVEAILTNVYCYVCLQVMNLLGAGSAARLALTRSLRGMSAQDREWLLSITYPHLQDSCRRHALPEVRLILNEVAGMDCFQPAAAAAAVAGAGGVKDEAAQVV